MEEISKQVYQILNVATIIDVATGLVWPLIAEQETANFVTYAFSGSDNLTKDGRVEIQLEIGSYGVSYTKALQIHDAVASVLNLEGSKLVGLESQYLNETRLCAVYSTYRLRLKQN